MDDQTELPIQYLLRERRLCGTRQEVIAELDELIEALGGVRQLLTKGLINDAVKEKSPLRLVQSHPAAVPGADLCGPPDGTKRE